MDGITQAAMGAVLGEWIFGKRLGKQALGWGALFGILPDLDVLLFPMLDSARQLAWHRGPSHSLLVMALVCFAISKGLAKLWKREKIPTGTAFGWVFGLCVVHALMDCLTVDGAGLLWPFLGSRVSFNLIDDSDLLFKIPLWVTAVWLLCLGPAPVKKGRSKKPLPPSRRLKVLRWGTGVFAGYLVLAVGCKFLASAGFNADLSRRATRFERRMEVPTRGNILLWRAVVDDGRTFRVGYRTIFESHADPVPWTVYPKFPETLDPVSQLRPARTLQVLTGGWWIARRNKKGAWLGDIRQPEARTWDSKKGMVDHRITRSWLIVHENDSDSLRAVFPWDDGRNEYLSRLGSRIVGNRERWEANPRLAGVSGSLPESLMVEE